MNNIISRYDKILFHGNTYQRLSAFQAFCRALTCLETFSNQKTGDNGEKRWNELTTNGQQQWERVANHFSTGQLFQDKLTKIRNGMLNNKEYLFGTVSDEDNKLCEQILLGQCDLSIWTSTGPPRAASHHTCREWTGLATAGI